MNFSLQKEISSSYWPTEGSLARLAEKWGVTIQGYPITKDNFKNLQKSNNEDLKNILDALKDHVSDNYLKVSQILRTIKIS